MQNFAKYFSGFSFKDERSIFDKYIPKSSLCVAGFSLGAIDAFEYTLGHIHRIDRLVLLSPAFFNSQNDSFKSAQLRAFDSNKEKYIKRFYENLSQTENDDICKYYNIGTANELEKLLYYRWCSKELKSIIEKGVVVEVFIGKNDQIIDSSTAIEFFSNSGAVVYALKDTGHVLT